MEKSHQCGRERGRDCPETPDSPTSLHFSYQRPTQDGKSTDEPTSFFSVEMGLCQPLVFDALNRIKRLEVKVAQWCRSIIMTEYYNIIIYDNDYYDSLCFLDWLLAGNSATQFLSRKLKGTRSHFYNFNFNSSEVFRFQFQFIRSGGKNIPVLVIGGLPISSAH